MRKVEFVFNLGEVVVVKALGNEGVVQMLGCDRGGAMCYVVMAGEHGWFYEDQLKAVKEEG